MTDSCCCTQRFPVIRLGEGKYRIGESGTIIFIRVGFLIVIIINYLLCFVYTDSQISCYGSCWWWLGYS